MKFKKPDSKTLKTVATGFAGFEVGKRVGRGVVGVIPSKDESQDLLIKGGLAAASLLAAASYTGKHKDILVPAFVGLAAEQVGDIIDAQAKKMITKKANPGMPEKFLYDSMGLGCPCNNQPYLASPHYPMLASPTIQEIEWDAVFEGEDPYTIQEFTGV